MDKSETFIKMCDCPEIQIGYLPRDGDWFAVDTVIYIWVSYDRITNQAHLNGKFIWLPRQDQLQEMCSSNLWDVIEGFNLLFIDGLDVGNQCLNEYAQRFNSMEQIWLAFVMKEKFNKVWNGNEWVNPTINKEEK